MIAVVPGNRIRGGSSRGGRRGYGVRERGRATGDHNIRQVISMSELVYVMSRGRIAASGPRARFAEDLHGQVRQWLGIAL